MYLLTLASFVFYAQWDMLHLGLLFVSVMVNYAGARVLWGRFGGKLVVFSVVGFDVLVLGYFKYSGFLHLSDGSVVLPLAISFYTFQQIAYIVDVYRRRVELGSFWEYLFFVMFFPQLIAGPIVHYNVMMGQVKRGMLERFDIEKFQAGIVLFSMGMFSKVVLADNLVRDRYEDWAGLFSYSLMIYFDFSGYANMAIGLGLMFGVMLPLNFFSPYKARNISEFWRRWHITLGAFLKEHIYIPLGGSRSGYGVQVFALLATMVVGGVWHGAGWNFLLWGVMHGVGLVVVHLSGVRLPKILAVGLTFLYVMLLWVLFFSSSVSEALMLYERLFSFGAFELGYIDAAFLGAGLLLVWFLPNASEVLGMRDGVVRVKSWHGVLAGVLFFVSLKILSVTPAATFVYFNF
jgi:D-alanyl-lipoteichoic acid acyltransferase DltB (MBOAT superfamily)